jgi:beta-glucosidase-like glycosyl hydrolase
LPDGHNVDAKLHTVIKLVQLYHQSVTIQPSQQSVMPESIFADAVQAILEGSTSVQEATERIFAEFTEDEKLSLLDGGDTPMEFIRKTLKNGYCGIPQPALQVPRLGLPGIHFSDGPRGILSGTAFPTPSARANSWNPELEEDVVSCSLVPGVSR